MIDGLVFRYDSGETEDGLPPGEGAFLACSFWFVDNLIMQGRLGEAHAMFERLLGLRNDVGLVAEEYDPRERRQMGNFPQAFSHVALVNTAYNLTAASDQRNSLLRRQARHRQPSFSGNSAITKASCGGPL